MSSKHINKQSTKPQFITSTKELFHVASYSHYYSSEVEAKLHSVYNLNWKFCTPSKLIRLLVKLASNEKDIIFTSDKQQILVQVRRLLQATIKEDLPISILIDKKLKKKEIEKTFINKGLINLKIREDFIRFELNNLVSLLSRFINDFSENKTDFDPVLIKDTLTKVLFYIRRIKGNLEVHNGSSTFQLFSEQLINLIQQFQSVEVSRDSKHTLSESVKYIYILKVISNNLEFIIKCIAKIPSLSTTINLTLIHTDNLSTSPFSNNWQNQSYSVASALTNPEHHVYTDGSIRFHTLATFSGLVALKTGHILYHWHYQILELVPSINFVELFAILFALDQIKSLKTKILIHTDSQVALTQITQLAHNRRNTGYFKLYPELKGLLNALKFTDQVSIKKVKGHAQCLGNCFADIAARYAHIYGDELSWIKWVKKVYNEAESYKSQLFQRKRNNHFKFGTCF